MIMIKGWIEFATGCPQLLHIHCSLYNHLLFVMTSYNIVGCYYLINEMFCAFLMYFNNKPLSLTPALEQLAMISFYHNHLFMEIPIIHITKIYVLCLLSLIVFLL